MLFFWKYFSNICHIKNISQGGVRTVFKLLDSQSQVRKSLAIHIIIIIFFFFIFFIFIIYDNDDDNNDDDDGGGGDDDGGGQVTS